MALTTQTDEQNLAPVYERAHALVESIDRQARPRAFLNVALLQVEVLATMGQEDAALTELLPLESAPGRAARPRRSPGSGR